MNKHILLVDDEAPIREMLALALGRSGYRVTDVSSAAEAERIVQSDPPHLIISDLQLEESDGLDLIAKVKATAPHVPVILLTGVLFDEQVVRDALGDKISCYLHKSSPLSKIVAEVRRLLGQ